jgi:hypothetical protein
LNFKNLFLSSVINQSPQAKDASSISVFHLFLSIFPQLDAAAGWKTHVRSLALARA